MCFGTKGIITDYGKRWPSTVPGSQQAPCKYCWVSNKWWRQLMVAED